MYRKPDGELGQGPFTLETRKEILKRLLLLEKETGLQLITQEELKQIDEMWDSDGDLSRRSLVELYYSIIGSRLPWDEYKSPIFSEEVINEVKAMCIEHEVDFELISKLIVEINANKNYTKSSMVTKTFDKIINQGWLHFENIERGLKNEN